MSNILKAEGISLNLASVSKEEAILAAGEKLHQLGYVHKNYNSYMLERENISTTYIGNHVAIPHGTKDSKAEVINAGIVVMQYPNGINFGKDNIAYFVIGIAGKNDEHVDIICNLADVADDADLIKKLSTVTDENELLKAFSL